MNIYITHVNEAWLREQPTSMSGIINGLLDRERTGVGTLERVEPVPERRMKLYPPRNRPGIQSLANVLAEEAEEPDMSRYRWDHTVGKVFDTQDEEYVPGKLVDGKIVLL